MNTLLIVDDDPGVIESFKVLLEENYHILTAASGNEALKQFKKRGVDLVLLDILLPDMDGLDVLKEIKKLDEAVEVIMVTAIKTVSTAIKAMKLGAYDYITKPFDIDEVAESIKKVLERQRLVREVEYLRSEVNKPPRFENIIGNSQKMKEIYQLILDLAKNETTVLISGASGTGKELIARAIHYNSKRQDKPFVTVDCSAIPENLIENEFFGHEKGAFTDAISQKLGKFEIANSGTIFLDEVGNLRKEMQAKLLRVLQEREINRLGGTKPIKIDVRVIAATNINLKRAVRDGKFREDLFYRLNVVPIEVPSLKERREDIPLMVDYFFKFYRKKACKKKIKKVSPYAIKRLTRYDWPGNVRELMNVMERMVVLCKRNVIDHRMLPLEILAAKREEGVHLVPKVKPLKEVVDQFEKEYVVSVLKRVNWNQSRAAKIMGIHRNTLIYKLAHLGIKEEYEW